jgi:hypothetical protein
MVQAIQNNRKTMTRRTRGLDLINSDPDSFHYRNKSNDIEIWCFPIPADHKNPDDIWYRFSKKNNNSVDYINICPYGIPRDILWVKETFYAYGHWTTITENGKSKRTFHDLTTDNHYLHQFAADWKPGKQAKFGELGWHKRPAIYMPKSIARIWLENTGVTVERLNEISKQDATSEGITEYAYGYWKNYLSTFSGGRPKTGIDFKSSIDSFKTLWQSINGPESWDANPWVWVISFKVLSTTGKPGDI